jgi:TP901 family phage tail tape measure protein
VATIKIRVGVGLDANPASVFASIPAAAKKATDKVNGEFSASGKKVASVYRTSATEAERAAEKGAAAAEKGAKKEAAAYERALKHVSAMRDRYFREQQRREEKQAAAQSRVNAVNASYATRFAASGLRAGGRFAMDIARGAGVNLDLGSIIGKSVAMERRAVDLANASIGTGVAGNESRVNAGDLSKQARDIGATMGFDPERVLEGLQKFVGKTGDLKTGRDTLASMAKLASATGSELEDIVDAAGDVSNAIGEVPNKGKVVESVMRAIAGQGKVGAVEMKDLATQMAKLGAAAGAFGGDKAAAIEKMGILAQMARATGGAASASQATTAVGRFVTQLQTPARIKEFLAAGVKKEDIYDAKGGLRDPFEIIKRSIAATGADPLKMHKLFASSVGAKPVDALTKVYRDAGGGKAGMSAIDAEVARLAKSAMTDAAVNEAHAERMKTSAAKVEQFNAKLTEIGARAAEGLLPALEKAGPDLLRLADAAGKFTVWIAENPKTAIGTLIAGAIVASIAKAAIGDMVGKAIGGALGGGGLALGALTLVATTAYLIAKEYTDKSDTAQKAAEDMPALVEKAQKQIAKTGTVDKDTIDELARARADLESMRTTAKGGASVEPLSYTQILAAKITGGSEQIAEAEGRSTAAKGMGAEKIDSLIGKMDQVISAFAAGKIKAKVDVTVNQADGKPVVDQAARTGP